MSAKGANAMAEVAFADRIVVSIGLDETRSGPSWITTFNDIAADADAGVRACGGPLGAVLLANLQLGVAEEARSYLLDEVRRIVDKADRKFVKDVQLALTSSPVSIES